MLLDLDLEYPSLRSWQRRRRRVAGQVSAAIPARPLSLNPAATARALVLLVGLTLLLAGLTRLLNVTGARRLVTGIVAFGAVLALVGIIQYAVLGDHAWGGMRIYGFWAPMNRLTTPFGPFVNKNHFAGWMLMGLPLAMGLALGWAERAQRNGSRGWRDGLLWLSSRDGGKLQLAALAVMVMGVSLLMTRSRSGIAGFVLSTIDCRRHRRQAVFQRAIPVAGDRRAGVDAGWARSPGPAPASPTASRPGRWNSGGSSGATAPP